MDSIQLLFRKALFLLILDSVFGALIFPRRFSHDLNKRNVCTDDNVSKVQDFFNQVMSTMISNLPETSCCFKLSKNIGQFSCSKCKVRGMNTLHLIGQDPFSCNGDQTSFTYTLGLNNPFISCECSHAFILRLRKADFQFALQDVEASGRMTVSTGGPTAQGNVKNISVFSITNPIINLKNCNFICVFEGSLLNTFGSPVIRDDIAIQLANVIQELIQEQVNVVHKRLESLEKYVNIPQVSQDDEESFLVGSEHDFQNGMNMLTTKSATEDFQELEEHGETPSENNSDESAKGSVGDDNTDIGDLESVEKVQNTTEREEDNTGTSETPHTTLTSNNTHVESTTFAYNFTTSREGIFTGEEEEVSNKTKEQFMTITQQDKPVIIRNNHRFTAGEQVITGDDKNDKIEDNPQPIIIINNHGVETISGVDSHYIHTPNKDETYKPNINDEQHISEHAPAQEEDELNIYKPVLIRNNHGSKTEHTILSESNDEVKPDKLLVDENVDYKTDKPVIIRNNHGSHIHIPEVSYRNNQSNSENLEPSIDESETGETVYEVDDLLQSVTNNGSTPNGIHSTGVEKVSQPSEPHIEKINNIFKPHGLVALEDKLKDGEPGVIGMNTESKHAVSSFTGNEEDFKHSEPTEVDIRDELKPVNSFVTEAKEESEDGELFETEIKNKSQQDSSITIKGEDESFITEAIDKLKPDIAVITEDPEGLKTITSVADKLKPDNTVVTKSEVESNNDEEGKAEVKDILQSNQSVINITEKEPEVYELTEAGDNDILKTDNSIVKEVEEESKIVESVEIKGKDKLKPDIASASVSEEESKADESVEVKNKLQSNDSLVTEVEEDSEVDEPLKVEDELQPDYSILTTDKEDTKTDVPITGEVKNKLNPDHSLTIPAEESSEDDEPFNLEDKLQLDQFVVTSPNEDSEDDKPLDVEDKLQPDQSLVTSSKDSSEDNEPLNVEYKLQTDQSVVTSPKEGSEDDEPLNVEDKLQPDQSVVTSSIEGSEDGEPLNVEDELQPDQSVVTSSIEGSEDGEPLNVEDELQPDQSVVTSSKEGSEDDEPLNVENNLQLDQYVVTSAEEDTTTNKPIEDEEDSKDDKLLEVEAELQPDQSIIITDEDSKFDALVEVGVDNNLKGDHSVVTEAGENLEISETFGVKGKNGSQLNSSLVTEEELESITEIKHKLKSNIPVRAEVKNKVRTNSPIILLNNHRLNTREHIPPEYIIQPQNEPSINYHTEEFKDTAESLTLSEVNESTQPETQFQPITDKTGTSEVIIKPTNDVLIVSDEENILDSKKPKEQTRNSAVSIDVPNAKKQVYQ
ncbi:uncharacterized protein LOC143232001 [Tachypleus tridentatus]|uniref:uncharacterized protein LOC143232001 n=1 Tax=Tachypleus tridentatus TaxID=6853 RepID=UPI003FD58C40